MHMQEQDYFTVNQEEEFSRPVESIMRCEDFKSNFARRLSNRYISRTPKQDPSLKLRPPESKNAEAIPDNVPERVEPVSQHSKNLEQNSEAIISPGKSTATNSVLQHAEVTALHLEVDTLRWQLAQTEANRQMHIALLNQIVTFLNRVKDHIECQKSSENGSLKDIAKERALPRSFNSADLPRSRSVVHVNKHNIEYSLSPPKKIGTRKISKSISNVNGFKDCSGIWNQSKISLTSETDSYKITEEMSRLITLANTVLSTKLPDLTCGCNDIQNVSNATIIAANNDKKQFQSFTTSTMDLIEEDMTSALVIKNVCDSADLFEDLPGSLVDAVYPNLTEYVPPSALTCNLVDGIAQIKVDRKEQQSPICKNKSNGKTSRTFLSNRRLDYHHTTNNFIEDESGFSSMSSFQEIGIPIISIIPPSPCKEVGYVDDIPELMEETGKWNSELELNKQNVKVFWV